MIQNCGGLNLGASTFGTVFVGPFPVGWRIVGVSFTAGSTSFSVRVGMFRRRLVGSTAAQFAAAGEFFSSADVVIAVVAAFDLPICHVVDDARYVGIGVTTGVGQQFIGAISVEYERVGAGLFSGGGVSVAVPDSGSSPPPGSGTSSPNGVHSPGYYGTRPGPG